MKSIEEILEMLPGSWSEFKLKDYIRFSNLELQFRDEHNGLYVDHTNTLKLVALFTGISEEELESEMPLKNVIKCGEKLSFLDNMPEVLKKGKIKWKSVEEMTHGDYIQYNQLQMETIANAAKIIQLMAAPTFRLSEEEILELGMDEVHTGFFLLRQHIKTSLENIIVSSTKKVIDQMRINRFKKALLRFRANYDPSLLKSIKHTAGI